MRQAHYSAWSSAAHDPILLRCCKQTMSGRAWGSAAVRQSLVRAGHLEPDRAGAPVVDADVGTAVGAPEDR